MYDEKLIKTQEYIRKHSVKFKKPYVHNMNEIKTHSWFNLHEYKENLFSPEDVKIKEDKIINDGYYTKQFKLELESWQKEIIDKWMNAYIHMYNETNKYFKTQKFNKDKCDFSIKNLKVLLRKEKEKIHLASKLIQGKRKIYVNKHSLDYAINDAINRYRSCLTNLKNGHIKRFRLRYLKLTKQEKIIKFEKLSFNKHGFCARVFGSIKCNIEDFNYRENIVTTSIVRRNNKGEYWLFIKHKAKKKDRSNNNIISLDPGINPPFTGYGNDGILKIGENYNKVFRKKLEKIDNIDRNVYITKVRRNKLKKEIYERLKNKVNDMHWKVINYLINNYGAILIGNLSTKKIGEKDDINGVTKRLGNLLNLYKFKQKMMHKCGKTRYKEVDESYTSKCCCNCSNYKKDLGGVKIYECVVCKMVINRDVNGAINILIKANE